MKLKKMFTYEFMVLLPILLFMIIFYFYPLLNILKISLIENGGITFEHFRMLFATDLYVRVFLESLRIALAVTLGCLFIGYPFAYYISYSKYKLALFGVVGMSMWLSDIIRSYGWMGVLGQNGVMNYFLTSIGLQKITLLYTESAIVIGMVHILMPYMVLPIFSVINSMNQNVLKASQSLGANNFYTFMKVFLPISLPGIIAGCLLVFIQAIGFYITPALLGGKSNMMIAQLIDIQVSELLNWPFASVLSLSLLTITIGALFVCSKLVPMSLLWGGK